MQMSEIQYFYAEHLRDVFFLGFLAISGFLYLTNTFITITMHTNVYSSDSYSASVRHRKRIDPTVSHYGPLRRFCTVIDISTQLSFFTAITQLTLGFSSHPHATCFCILAAFITFVAISWSLFLIKMNLNYLLAEPDEK